MVIQDLGRLYQLETLQHFWYLHIGWKWSFGNSRYFWSKQKGLQMTWADAKKWCEQENSHLVKIETKEENDYLIGKFNKYSWIGANDLVKEGAFQWVDGSLVTFSAWGEKEPNGGTAENCVQFHDVHNNLWNDGKCDLKNFFICERE